MAIETQQLARSFRYNSVDLQDPGPEFNLEQVRDFYSTMYPEIISAAIEGPEQKDDKLVYTFRRAVGTKGAALTFDALRAANRARLPKFKNKHGELAHLHPEGRDWSPAQWLQALTGELGEYANVRKKYERGDLNDAEFQECAAKELADVQTYLDILAFQLGVDLGEATRAKFNEVSERVGCDVKL